MAETMASAGQSMGSLRRRDGRASRSDGRFRRSMTPRMCSRGRGGRSRLGRASRRADAEASPAPTVRGLSFGVQVFGIGRVRNRATSRATRPSGHRGIDTHLVCIAEDIMAAMVTRRPFLVESGAGESDLRTRTFLGFRRVSEELFRRGGGGGPVSKFNSRTDRRSRSSPAILIQGVE